MEKENHTFEYFTMLEKSSHRKSLCHLLPDVLALTCSGPFTHANLSIALWNSTIQELQKPPVISAYMKLLAKNPNVVFENYAGAAHVSWAIQAPFLKVSAQNTSLLLPPHSQHSSIIYDIIVCIIEKQMWQTSIVWSVCLCENSSDTSLLHLHAFKEFYFLKKS